MSFEEFQSRGRIFSKDPRVTITKMGQIHFNATCVAQWIQPRGATHVILMYDRETRRIGFKLLTHEAPHAYMLRFIQNAAQCSGASFLHYYEIDHDQTRSYPAEWSESDRAIVVRLDEGRVVGQKRKTA